MSVEPVRSGPSTPTGIGGRRGMWGLGRPEAGRGAVLIVARRLGRGIASGSRDERSMVGHGAEVGAQQVDELATLPQLVDEIEGAGALAGEGEPVDGVRELIEHLRFQAEAIVSLVARLERIAGHR